MDVVRSDQDDFESSLARKAERDAQLSRALLLVLTSLVGAWLLGLAGLSFAWLLLLLLLVAALWNSRLSHLLDSAVRYEILRVRRRRVMGQGTETAEWLNLMVNRWWMFSSHSLFAIIKEHLEPLLNEAKPTMVESLELRQFTLGEGTPHIRSVRVLDAGKDRGPTLGVRQQLVLEADVALDSDDFRLVLRTRLFGKGVGMDLDLAMEKLNVSGRLLATVTLDMEAPFPHLALLSLTFVEKPQLWFSVRALKAVQMMEVPLLKTWIHSMLMDALVTALVDPGKLDIHLAGLERPQPGGEVPATEPLAQGVLTATISGNGPTEDAERWLVLALGSQRRRTSPLALPQWSESASFLVGSLQANHLLVKLKSKRLVTAVTLAQFDLPLAGLGLDSTSVTEKVLQKKGGAPPMSIRLEYTALPPEPEAEPEQELSSGASGVIYVYVHGAQGLAQGEGNECNPYCMVFHNRNKVKTTHYVRGTCNPQWESRTQFLVSDLAQASLSFVVCSWSPRRMTDAELLGLASLGAVSGDRMMRKVLPLSGSGTNGASVLVSVLFHPVGSVGRRDSCAVDDNDMATLQQRSKRNSTTWMNQARNLLAPGHRDIGSLLAMGLGLMEVGLIRACDLEAKDMNGFSDPYCEVKVGGECKYKSIVKKKTLHPEWEESALVGLPRTGEVLEVVLWDHDTFGTNDFLGSVTLNLEDIRRLSTLDSAQCCPLQGVKSGSLDLRIKVISEDTEPQSYQHSNPATSSSPRMPIRQKLDSIRRSSGERSKLRLHMNGNPVLPPAPPPRTVTLGLHNVAPADDEDQYSTGDVCNSPRLGSSSPQPVPRVTVTDLPVSITNGRNSHSQSSSPDSQFKKSVHEYSSFRIMKQKVKRGLKLRRFRSEASMTEKDSVSGKSSSTVAALSLEPSGGGESDATELLLDGLAHAVSQPNMLSSRNNRPRRPIDLKVPAPLRPDHYFGVEGKVLQAQGLHVAHVAQLYCRVKLHSASSPDKLVRVGSNAGGRTLAKSRLLPAVPNPQFDLSFQLDNPDSVPRHAALMFEIRSSGKEVVGSRRVTLQDLLSAASPDTHEIHTWLALNNGASLEVEIAHSRELKKPGRRIFRSWSVHRIGRI